MWTDSFTTQYPDGATYHVCVHVTYAIENNAPKWLIAYSVNGRWWHRENYAGYGARHNPLYLRTLDMALFRGKMAALHRIENFRMAIDQPLFVRMQKILDTIRYDATLQKLAEGVYPDVLNDRITIQCADVYQDTIADAIAGLTDGIDIVWKCYTVQPFTGMIADSGEQKLAS